MIRREVLPSRLRPGWRMAIALPVVVALAIGAVEAGHAVARARDAAAAHLQLIEREAARLEIETIAAWPADRGYPSVAGCGHGGALVAAVAFGAGLAIVCILIGLAIAGGRWAPGRWSDDDGGDGGDELELEPLLEGLERIAIIKVPRHDAPGAPAPPQRAPDPEPGTRDPN